jgi:hypothetical protein
LTPDSAAGPYLIDLAGRAFGHPRPGAVVIFIEGWWSIEPRALHSSFLADSLVGLKGYSLLTCLALRVEVLTVLLRDFARRREMGLISRLKELTPPDYALTRADSPCQLVDEQNSIF